MGVLYTVGSAMSWLMQVFKEIKKQVCGIFQCYRNSNIILRFIKWDLIGVLLTLKP